MTLKYSIESSFSGTQAFSFEDLLAKPNDTYMLWAKGGETITPSPYLWPSATITPFGGATTPDMFFYKFHNVKIVGPSIALREDKALFPAGSVPEYVSRWVAEGWFSDHFPVFAGVTQLGIREVETAFVPFHFNMSVYGHFLLEIVPRLFLIRELAARGYTYPIVLFSGGASWVQKLTETICPKNKIILYDRNTEALRVKNALIPPCGAQYYCLNANIRARFQFIGANAPLAKAPGERLFIVRNNPRSFRFLENHEEIRDICLRFGFKAVSPENYTWHEQAGIFRRASLVVGEFTSSLHNTVFCRPGTQVVALNRINDVQDAIAASFGHRVGYLMPEDGKPRIFSRNWKTRQDFRVSGVELAEKLKILCRPWTSMV